MIKDVLINITGTQGLGEEADTIEFTTDGRFGKKDDSYFITYQESALTGLEGSKTTLYLREDNSVVLQRTGSVQSRLVVQKGVRNACYYSTLQGDILIGIFGEEVEHNLSPVGGNIKMCYTIDSNLSLISRNTVNISIKEVKQDVNTRGKSERSN